MRNKLQIIKTPKEPSVLDYIPVGNPIYDLKGNAVFLNGYRKLNCKNCDDASSYTLNGVNTNFNEIFSDNKCLKKSTHAATAKNSKLNIKFSRYPANNTGLRSLINDFITNPNSRKLIWIKPNVDLSSSELTPVYRQSSVANANSTNAKVWIVDFGAGSASIYTSGSLKVISIKGTAEARMDTYTNNGNKAIWDLDRSGFYDITIQLDGDALSCFGSVYSLMVLANIEETPLNPFSYSNAELMYTRCDFNYIEQSFDVYYIE